MKNKIYVKIYTEDDDNILVIEGAKTENKDYYYPHKSIIGGGVTGKEHISITNEAKKLFKKLVIDGSKTGDDITCLDIQNYNGRIHISWLGSRIQKIDSRKLDEIGFFIGTGEGFPNLCLLDELSENLEKIKGEK